MLLRARMQRSGFIAFRCGIYSLVEASVKNDKSVTRSRVFANFEFG